MRTLLTLVVIAGFIVAYGVLLAGPLASALGGGWIAWMVALLPIFATAQFVVTQDLRARRARPIAHLASLALGFGTLGFAALASVNRDAVLVIPMLVFAAAWASLGQLVRLTGGPTESTRLTSAVETIIRLRQEADVNDDSRRAYVAAVGDLETYRRPETEQLIDLLERYFDLWLLRDPATWSEWIAIGTRLDSLAPDAAPELARIKFSTSEL